MFLRKSAYSIPLIIKFSNFYLSRGSLLFSFSKVTAHKYRYDLRAGKRDGKWVISNFILHFTEDHMKKNPSAASPSIPSLLASNNFASEQTIQNKRGNSISQHQLGKFEV